MRVTEGERESKKEKKKAVQKRKREGKKLKEKRYEGKKKKTKVIKILFLQFIILKNSKI